MPNTVQSLLITSGSDCKGRTCSGLPLPFCLTSQLSPHPRPQPIRGACSFWKSPGSPWPPIPASLPSPIFSTWEPLLSLPAAALNFHLWSPTPTTLLPLVEWALSSAPQLQPTKLCSQIGYEFSGQEYHLSSRPSSNISSWIILNNLVALSGPWLLSV